jgi:ABC-type sugar transport system ATPase subunit
MSDRILVMQSGRLVGEVPGNRATEENVIALAAGTIKGGVGK